MDFMFRVDLFPTPSTKSPISEFVITGGGCAANAAIAVSRLGGNAQFCGPLGDDPMSDRIVQGLIRERVDVGGVVRVAGAEASVSAVFIDQDGERLLATKRDHGLRSARADDNVSLALKVDALVADNHFTEFVLPLCQAAAKRGTPVVLDIDKPTKIDDPLFAYASHLIFSAEALCMTMAETDRELALARAAEHCSAFVAVTDGAEGVHWRDGDRVRRIPAFPVQVIDTLAAGDVFHGAFALALAEGADEAKALRFASAAAALKCTKFGGIAGAPSRADIERLLASHYK
jgi:sulfofructose kinase